MTKSPSEEDLWLNELVQRTGHEKFRAYLEAIKESLGDLPQRIKLNGTKIVIVGGTNGKGETAMSLYQYLIQDGFKVALWTSPHILSVTERMGLNGRDIAFAKLKELSSKYSDSIKDLSFYESLFALFCYWISGEKLDVLILEVGLGGRYDAVNLFDADVAVITSIDLDHQEFLGDTREKILAEKYPIVRPQAKLLSTVHYDYLRKLLSEWTKRDNVDWKDLFDCGIVRPKMNYSLRNRYLAAHILEQLNLKKIQIEEYVSRSLKLKARQEMMTYLGNSFIFIGAHNREGFTEMMQLLNEKGDHYDRIMLSFSKRALEDILFCMNSLAANGRFFKHIQLCYFDHPKALEKNVLLELVDEYSEKLSISFLEAVDSTVLEKMEASSNLVTGSYYFISHIQRLIQ